MLLKPTLYSGPHIRAMWWPDSRGLFVYHAIWHYSYARLTWYLIPSLHHAMWLHVELCDSIGPAVSDWFYFIIFYLVVNCWPDTASVDSRSRPETATVAYLILFFSKFCVQSYGFLLWGLLQVIPSFYIIYINLYISDFVPCVSSGAVVMGWFYIIIFFNQSFSCLPLDPRCTSLQWKLLLWVWFYILSIFN